uniref:Cytochrome P450 n=1 Tax=Kalanchoe fedtschenkoi TaxID=63787 RepID=A0A7N0TIE7_KALFE
MGILVISMASSLFSFYTSTAAFSVVLFLILSFYLLNTLLQISPKSQERQRRLPPGPAPWPIIGNLPEMLVSRPTFRWLHAVLEEMGTSIGCVRIGSVHLIPVTCPKIGLEFLKEQDATFASRPKTMASSIFSRNYLTVVFPPNGEQWRKMRKVLKSEILSPARHKWMHDKRTEEADNLVKYVYHQSLNGSVDVRSATRHYAANVIRKMVFNKRHFGQATHDGSPTAAEEEHVAAIFLSLKYLYSFCISDYYPFLEGLDLDGHEKYVKEAYKMTNKYHDPIIDERIRQWQQDDGHKEPQDLLDVMISLKDSNGRTLLSSEEIKAQTAELMLAAMDNPSNAIEWAMGEMINQPELLKKAVEELDRVVGRERLVQESDLPQLNFVKACAREAFRLHPIAPFTPPHVAMSDAVVVGYFIPKGSHVILSRMGLGRNPDVWEEPLKFKPERHLASGAEVVLTEQNLRFISFSTGRRGCVAATLGSCMTVMLLARLLQGFEWSAPGGAEKVDLRESVEDLFMATPLAARAVPRLPVHLYQAAV